MLLIITSTSDRLFTFINIDDLKWPWTSQKEVFSEFFATFGCSAHFSTDLRRNGFSRREISEMRGPTGMKFCMMVSTRPNFIMPVQNFLGGHPQKNSGTKNMKNLAQFQTTSKFGGEYLWNGWTYSKSDFYSVYGDSSCVRRNKSGEVWSSDLGDLDVKSYPPKAHFSEDHISAPRGCCTPNFYMR